MFAARFFSISITLSLLPLISQAAGGGGGGGGSAPFFGEPLLAALVVALIGAWFSRRKP